MGMAIVDLAEDLFSHMDLYVSYGSLNCNGRKNGHLWVLTLGGAHTPSAMLEEVFERLMPFGWVTYGRGAGFS